MLLLLPPPLALAHEAVSPMKVDPCLVQHLPAPGVDSGRAPLSLMNRSLQAAQFHAGSDIQLDAASRAQAFPVVSTFTQSRHSRLALGQL